MSYGKPLALMIGLTGLVAFSERALGSENASPACVEAAKPKAVVEARHGHWVELNAAQWEFLRGVYAMNPQTPPGLPYGDRAALARFDGDPRGIVFFIDGDKACTPMVATPEFLSMVDAVASHAVNHEGAGL